MTPYRLPQHAVPFFGSMLNITSPEFGAVPWKHSRVLAKAEDYPKGQELNGMAYRGLQGFPKELTDEPTENIHHWKAILWQSDADVDTDGPGGSRREDPDYQPETSLRWPDTTSCNSHTFAGVVIPFQFGALFGLHPGDVAWVAWGGHCIAAQIYDIGPRTKIGEFSIALLKALGMNVTARIGHDAKDVVTMAFPGSCRPFAMEPARTQMRARQCLNELRNGYLAA